jgi:hypothetical protein
MAASPLSLQEARVDLVPADLTTFISRLTVCSLDMRALWSIGNSDGSPAAAHGVHELLAFADGRTLSSLRRNAHLHRPDVALLVVTDGDRFENAWGSSLSGSLARWAWRQVSPRLAFYDESKWAEREANAGTVVRVRRRAVLMWSAEAKAA